MSPSRQKPVRRQHPEQVPQQQPPSQTVLPATPVTCLKNVGPKREALYLKLGIQTVEELLTIYPRNYQDFTSPKMADQCVGGENVVIAGKILRKFPPAPIRKGMVLYKMQATDGLHNFVVTIFNSEYTYYGMKTGKTMSLPVNGPVPARHMG